MQRQSLQQQALGLVVLKMLSGSGAEQYWQAHDVGELMTKLMLEERQPPTQTLAATGG